MNDSLVWLQQNVIAVIAAIVSALAALASIRASRKSIAAQDRLLQIEENRDRDRIIQNKRAKLTGQIKKNSHSQFTLEIYNHGEAEAHDVSVFLDDKPLLEHPVIPIQRLPQPPSSGFHVGPASHVRYILGPTQQTRGPFNLILKWADESGEPGEFKTTLSIF